MKFLALADWRGNPPALPPRDSTDDDKLKTENGGRHTPWAAGQKKDGAGPI